MLLTSSDESEFNNFDLDFGDLFQINRSMGMKDLKNHLG